MVTSPAKCGATLVLVFASPADVLKTPQVLDSRQNAVDVVIAAGRPDVFTIGQTGGDQLPRHPLNDDSSRSHLLFFALLAGTRARGFSGADSGTSELYIARRTFHEPSACLRQMVRYLPRSSMGAAPEGVKVME